MNKGSERFILTVVLGFAGMIVALTLIGISASATTQRFGGIGWAYLIIGVLAVAAALIVVWATVITSLDRRDLKRYRADPDDAFWPGQVVALSGCIRVEGEPLTAPFSGTACAAYNYQVTGQHRDLDNHDRAQLCLLGFALADARLDCTSRSFPLGALPDVDTDLRENAIGGEWGDLGLEKIQRAARNREPADGSQALGALSDARKVTNAPQSVDFFIAPTRAAGSKISVIEDAVPVNVPVTVLATYDARTGGLDGRRLRGLKIFAGTFDERLPILDQEWRKGMQVGPALLGIGLALLTLAWWWPTG